MKERVRYSQEEQEIIHDKYRDLYHLIPGINIRKQVSVKQIVNNQETLKYLNEIGMECGFDEKTIQKHIDSVKKNSKMTLDRVLVWAMECPCLHKNIWEIVRPEMSEFRSKNERLNNCCNDLERYL